MQKGKKKNRNTIFILMAILLIIAVIVLIWRESKDNTGASGIKSILPNSANDEEICLSLGSNINLIGIDTYTGAYVEDGSDEYVENIMMITLENKGEEYIQLATVTINGKYIFDVTTLLPGEKMMVLEKNCSEYNTDIKIDSAELSNLALFSEQPSMHEELLEISGEDHMITVTNISGEDFAGGKVFYKNVLNDKFLGGITYFGSIPEMEAGQTIKLSANHYLNDSSKLMFVTYAE